MRLAVIIPAYNEASKIGTVVASIPRSDPGVDHTEVIVVDDGSDDNTSEAARAAGADVVYRHRQNCGVVNAFASGVTIALHRGADIIVNIDADGQFDPDEIPRLITPIIDGKADVVLGSRLLGRAADSIPTIKRIGNQIVSAIVSVLVGRRIYDTQCGFRAMSRRAAEAMDLMRVFTYTQQMVMDLSLKRMRIVEMPVSVTYSKKRRSRVVKSIHSYTFKVVGVMLAVILRRFGLWLAVLFGLSIGFGYLLPPVIH